MEKEPTVVFPEKDHNLSESRASCNSMARRSSYAMDEEFLQVTQDEFEDLDPPDHIIGLEYCLEAMRNGVVSFYRNFQTAIYRCFVVVAVIFYFVYFGYAMHVERLGNSHSVHMFWFTCITLFFFLIYLFKRFLGEKLNNCFAENISEPWTQFNEDRGGRPGKVISRIITAAITIILVIIIVASVGRKNPENLISLGGIIIQLFLCYILSVYPTRVKWRPVVAGLLLQFLFAVIILKTRIGYDAFSILGDYVTRFLMHSSYGKSFVFDTDKLVLTSFAFRIVPIIFFFSSVISILYYLGAMQMVIEKVAWVMQLMMGTTAGESLNSGANMFVGMTEAPLLIRPFIGRMTNSELHAVMTGGFATVAGSVLGAYIAMGNPANHLIAASVMSAPAALAVSKLIYPETKKSLTTSRHVKSIEESPHKNMVEAASAGVITAIPLVANIVAIIIAFLALLDFVNQTLTWCGHRAGMQQDLTFQFICSYLLWPLSFIMGVHIQDCRKVSELIGVKTFINEFVAYDQLGMVIKNTRNYEKYIKANPNLTITEKGSDSILSDPYRPNVTYILKDGYFISHRSELIATYSLCGFSNFGSMGIMIGCLVSMAPRRRSDISSCAMRSMIAGNIACFLTACIAGLFYEPETEN